MTDDDLTFSQPAAGRVWLCIFGVLGAAVCIDGIVSAPAPGPLLATIALVLILGCVLRALTVRPSLIRNDVVEYHGFLRSREFPLAGARKLHLNPNQGGFGQLCIQPREGRPTYFQVMINSFPFVRNSLPPDELDRLGQRLLATGHVHAEDLRTLLHLQAEHLRAGGSLDTSPLRGTSNADDRTYLGDSTLTMLLRRAHDQG